MRIPASPAAAAAATTPAAFLLLSLLLLRTGSSVTAFAPSPSLSNVAAVTRTSPVASSVVFPSSSARSVPSSANLAISSPRKWTPRRTAYASAKGRLHRSSSSSALSSSAAAAESEKPSLLTKNVVPALSASLFVLLDVYFRNLLKSLNVSFPSSLAGCGALLAVLLTSDSINGEWTENVLYGKVLEPGSALLAKWLPLFFVPSLVTLPLARSLGGGVELAKIVAVVVGGFFFTLLTTSWSVLGVRSVLSSSSDGDDGDTKEDPAPAVEVKDKKEEADATPASPSPPKAFSESTLNALTTLAVGFGGAAVAAVKNGAEATLSTPLKTASMLFSTLASFVFGARLPSGFTKAVHPLVTCTTLTWLSARVLGALTGGTTFLAMLGEYKKGTMCPVHAGAGDLLLFMLGPAVVSLACQMYGKRKLVARNAAEVGTAVGVSSVGGLFGTALMVRLLKISDPVLRLTMLSRNITSPLAMAIASMVGADVSLAVSTVVITGLIGANFGASILDKFGIHDPVARGLGIGAAAHGLGTAAFKDEEDAFPFAAIAMALTACTCTVLVSVPGVKAALLNLALG